METSSLIGEWEMGSACRAKGEYQELEECLLCESVEKVKHGLTPGSGMARCLQIYNVLSWNETRL